MISSIDVRRCHCSNSRPSPHRLTTVPFHFPATASPPVASTYVGAGPFGIPGLVRHAAAQLVWGALRPHQPPHAQTGRVREALRWVRGVAGTAGRQRRWWRRQWCRWSERAALRRRSGGQLAAPGCMRLLGAAACMWQHCVPAWQRALPLSAFMPAACAVPP